MKTLAQWAGYLSESKMKIECAEMRLSSAFDSEAPIFRGPGYLEVPRSGRVEYTMFANAEDRERAAACLAQACQSPSDRDSQMRLVALDFRGVEWHGGWTLPRMKGDPRIGYPLTGELLGLSTEVSGQNVCPDEGVELLFSPAPWVPLEKSIVTTLTIDGREVGGAVEGGEHVIQVLGTEVLCTKDPVQNALWLETRTSEFLSHPYAEGWLSEPLRVLLGTLLYPRLTARNFGDGRARVQLMPVPSYSHSPSDVSLLGSFPFTDPGTFWGLYKNLLTVVAIARDASGQPIFELTHPITRYFEEIVQATKGSIWVLCMTLSGAVEGLVYQLNPRKKVDIERELQTLADSGIITKESRAVWREIRNQVMHGRLISPWAESDTGTQIELLMDMVRRLTNELIRVKCSLAAVK